MARSIVKKVTSLQSYKGDRRGAFQLLSNLVTRLTFLTLPPFRHLFRKRALCAIRIVPHAKVFVNLDQTSLSSESQKGKSTFAKISATRDSPIRAIFPDAASDVSV